MAPLLVLLGITVIDLFITKGESFPITGLISLLASVLLAVFNYKSLLIIGKIWIDKLLNRFSNFIEFRFEYDEINEPPSPQEVVDYMFNHFDIKRIAQNSLSKIAFDLKTESFNYNMTINQDGNSLCLYIEDLKVNNREYNDFEEDLKIIEDKLSVIIRKKPTYFILSQYQNLNPTFSAMFNHVKVKEINYGSFNFTVQKRKQELNITLTKDSVYASITSFLELKQFLGIANGVNTYIFTVLRYFS
ncbi:MAG: hypothetical protein PQJ58_15045 [Spirochaetales bacterium]|nr:hypothetical protein [Spirochaetales bacterium]